MAQSTLQIRILAQPQTSHRARYNSELDPRRNRPKRFIRADPNEHKFEHPTIAISAEWNNKKNLFIRVTLVTVPTEQAPFICVHPYSIDADDNTENIIKDVNRNALYFQITEDDFIQGYKSFRITRTKSVQHDLRNYGRLRILDTDQVDIQRTDDPTNVRKLIDAYQLGKSQLVFSLAELPHGYQLPVAYDATTVLSNIMTAISPAAASSFDDPSIKCVPRKGLCQGGEEVLMVLPKVDRRKSCRVILDHSSFENTDGIQAELVDTRTISFLTPRCPVQLIEHQNIEIPFVVLQGNEEIGRANFLYRSVGSCIICNTNTYEQSTLMEPYFDGDDDDTSISNPNLSFC